MNGKCAACQKDRDDIVASLSFTQLAGETIDSLDRPEPRDIVQKPFPFYFCRSCALEAFKTVRRLYQA